MSLAPRYDLENLRSLTIQYGEGWGYPHVRRVLHLAAEIGVDLAYDNEVFQTAAYLHDWGAFPRYRQAGVEHALRSRQVAESEILPYTALREAAQAIALEAIALHDYRDLRPVQSAEALLLREADLLDMLGVTGILREFAWGPNNLQTCYRRVLDRREKIAGRFTLPRAIHLAEQRLAHMDAVLAQFREDSFDLLGFADLSV